MSRKPLISYLIATRNRGDIIGETIESLLAQTVENIEIIVVDNGDDKTEEIIRGFEDPRLKYFRLKIVHGSGASCARNFAATQARADIVAIMDDDDIAFPNRTEVTLENFNQHPDADLFYAHIDVLEENTNVVRERKEIPYTEFSIEKLKERCFIPHPTVALRRQVLLDFPYNQFFRMAEDYELYSRLVEAGKKFISSPEKLVRYRIHSTNTSIGSSSVLELRGHYGMVARMQRGWIPFDYQALKEIERLEDEISASRGN